LNGKNPGMSCGGGAGCRSVDEPRDGFVVSYIYYLVAVWGVLLPHRVVLSDASGVPQKFCVDNQFVAFF
jgi:hypothetical protein